MSTASIFVTQGSARNGFPFCIPEIDVTSYQYVQPITIQEASRLYYNLESITMVADVLDDPETEEDETVTGLQIEQTHNNYDEVVKFTEISDPNADPGTSVVPFKIGTVHTEEANPVFGGNGIVDVDYVLTDLSNYEDAEPYRRAHDCSNTSSTTNRVKFASDEISSVRVEVDFTQLYHLYTQTNQFSEKEYIGYGFAMGAITMFAGITSLNGNQVSYGNFANDLDYVQSSPWFPPNWWGAQPGLWLGQALNNTSEPDNVESVPFTGGGFFIQATWSGRDSGFPTTWSVPPLDTGALNFFTYA